MYSDTESAPAYTKPTHLTQVRIFNHVQCAATTDEFNMNCKLYTYQEARASGHNAAHHF